MSKGHYFPITFTFKDNSRAMVACFNWSKKSGIDDREAFVAFATSFDENENKYLDRAELKKAADAFLEREEVEVKPMERDVPQEETEEEEAEEEE